MQSVNYISAPSGSGKTYHLVRSAIERANFGENILFLQPTKNLIDRTIEHELLNNPSPPLYDVFYGPDRSVARRLMEHFNNLKLCGHITFATHQVLPHISFLANKDQWHLYNDEGLQAVKHHCLRLPHTFRILTDHFDLQPHDDIYSRIIATDELKAMVRNREEDAIYEFLHNTTQLIDNSNYDSFLDFGQFQRLQNGTVKELSIHAALKGKIIDGFRSCTIACANFTDSLLYNLWSKQGIQFNEDRKITNALKFREHENGNLVQIKYAMDIPWSKAITKDNPDVFEELIKATNKQFNNTPFLWQANKSITDDSLFANGIRLPNVPHGLNDYSHVNNLAFLSALNPRPNDIKFLQSQGVTPKEVRRAIYCQAVYQSAMRTSIRNPENNDLKPYVVPDFDGGEYLQSLLSGSIIEKLKTGIVESQVRKSQAEQKPKGRLRKYQSDAERQAAYRLREKAKASVELK